MSIALPPGVHGVNNARAIWNLYSEERCSVHEIAVFFGIREERVQYVINQFKHFRSEARATDVQNDGGWRAGGDSGSFGGPADNRSPALAH